MTPTFPAIAASLVFSLAAPAVAAPPTADPSPAPSPSLTATPTLLNEIVVSAARTDEPAERIGNAYTRIDGDEIKRDQFNYLKQAVNLSPGTFISGAGTTGGIVTLSIRGNRPDHTLVLVDGVRANTGMFNNASPFLTNASSLNLETVEVVRGPYSTLFGSEAIGGVVSLQTLRGRGAPTTSLFFETGSFDTFREGILSSGSLGKLDYSLHYAHEDSANGQPNNDVELNTGSLRLDWRASDKLTLGLAVRTQVGQYDEPVLASPFGYPVDTFNKITGESTSVSTYVELQTTDIWTQRLMLGYYRERYTLINPPILPVFGLPYDDYIADSANFTLDWQNTVQITERNKAIAGATFLYETGHDNSFSWQTTSNVAIYAQDQWEIIDNLTLTGGLRYDHYELSGDAFTYRGAVAYLLEPTRTKFRASYGTAFKSPSFVQLFSTSPYFLGDPGLEPETSRGWDAGIDQYFLDDRMMLSATYFHNDISNLVTFIETSPFTGTYANRDHAETYGIEVAATAKFNDHWQARFAYTWTESHETTPLGVARSDYRPRHVISAETNYTFFEKLTLGAGVYYVAQQCAWDYNIGARVSTGDYTTFRLYGRYEVNPHVAVFARIENLADEKYVTRIDFPGMPRGFYGGVEIRF